MLSELQDHLEKKLGLPFRRMIVGQAGNNANTVQGTETNEPGINGIDYLVLTAYTATAFGASGGPQAGDDTFVLEISPHVHAIAFKVTYAA